MGKSEITNRQLHNRLKRIVGQLGAVERYLDSPDPLLALTQMEAVSAATRALIREFARMQLDSAEIPELTKAKILDRLLKKNY